MGILHISRPVCLPVGYKSNCLRTEPCHLKSINIVRIYECQKYGHGLQAYVQSIGFVLHGSVMDNQAVCYMITFISRMRHTLNVHVRIKITHFKYNFKLLNLEEQTAPETTL